MKKRDIAGEAGISISEQQKLTLPIIREIDRICRRHNLTYFLYFGSLLGAVRHGGFIPWDDDFDIMMPRADYWRFREIGRRTEGRLLPSKLSTPLEHAQCAAQGA